MGTSFSSALEQLIAPSAGNAKSGGLAAACGNLGTSEERNDVWWRRFTERGCERRRDRTERHRTM
jgi:hypothetical protein